MPGFDERYDPIYQRGHPGQTADTGQSAGASGNGQVRQVSGAGPAARPVPRPPEHAPFRVPDHPRRPSGSPGHEFAESPGISEVTPVDAAAEHGRPAASWKRKLNPFLLALWLFGIATLGLGIFAALVPLGVINTDQFAPGPGPSVWLFILPTLSPGFLSGGFACIGLALGLHALAWQRRH
jgi:hypothetical protein